MKLLTISLVALFITGCATQAKIETKRYDAEVSIVKFGFNKDQLADTFTVVKEAKTTLDEFINKNDDMYGRHGYEVGVVGHTDFKADEQYNDNLAMRRAQAVAHYIKDKGVHIFLVQSAGETDDVVTKPYRAENFPGVGYRETNRAVTLITLH